MMKKRIQFLSLSCLALMFAQPITAVAGLNDCKSYSPSQIDNAQPQKALQQILDALLACLAANRDNIQNTDFVVSIINKQLVPHADFTRMSKGVLAKNWRNATANERTAFEQELKQLVIRTYAAAFKAYTNQTVEYTDEIYSRDKQKVEIRTLIKDKEAPDLKMNYRLNLEGGYWKVYDINVEGISLVHSFRNQFSDSIRTKGLTQVIDEMKALNAGKKEITLDKGK